MRSELLRSFLNTGSAWLGRQRVFLAVLLLLSALFGPLPPLMDNEPDVLPLARQALRPDWLPRDWYLNQPPGYRAAFDFSVGWLVAALPIPVGAVIGRLLSFVLFASGLQALSRILRLRAGWTVLALIAFLGVFNQSLVANESMVKSLETKSFSYGFCLLALAALLRRRYGWASVLLGLAVSFHVLVGLYATLCALTVPLARSRRPGEARRRPLLWVGGFVVAAAPGLWSILEHLREPGGEVARAAERVYVHFRLPWHLLPSYWLAHDNALGWKLAGMALCAATLTAVAWRPPAGGRRLVAVFALASLGLFALGLIWAALGADRLLKFYWFRFPDTVVPFVACLLLADLLGRGLRRWVSGRLPAVLVVGLCLMGIAATGVLRVRQDLGPLRDESSDLPARTDVQRWVRANTPRDAVFLVDPFWDEFYLLAERARFVSFKHFPQTNVRILEWYHRLAGPGSDLLDEEPVADPRERIRRRFRQLSATDIRDLADRYGLTHAIVARDHDPFRDQAGRPAELYRNQRYVVYAFAEAGEEVKSGE